ncbi:hypothetical protein LRR18_17965, partial [Mangrovimonas sp. AS39]|uniref:hypothetical protein n=1 Tax=Mangrovimonas futianensis TaxID=2895523 RepID=UPI001E644E70
NGQALVWNSTKKMWVPGAASGGGGLTFVSTDGSLTGDGTPGDPLVVANPFVVAGSRGDIQVNDGSGALYADSNFNYNYSTGALVYQNSTFNFLSTI